MTEPVMCLDMQARGWWYMYNVGENLISKKNRQRLGYPYMYVYIVHVGLIQWSLTRLVAYGSRISGCNREVAIL